MCSGFGPAHLLLFHHPFADQFIHRGLHETARNVFTVAIPIPIIHQKRPIGPNIPRKFPHRLVQLFDPRLRLRLAEVPELAGVPWEYIYNPALNRFLALSTETPLVRYLDLPERIRPVKVVQPLRVLVMVAGPSDYARLRARFLAR